MNDNTMTAWRERRNARVEGIRARKAREAAVSRPRPLATAASAAAPAFPGAAAPQPLAAHVPPVAPALDAAPLIRAAIKADRQRIREILSAPEAAGREESAATFAFDTDFDVARARDQLRGMRLDADASIDEAVAQIVAMCRRRGT